MKVNKDQHLKQNVSEAFKCSCHVTGEQTPGGPLSRTCSVPHIIATHKCQMVRRIFLWTWRKFVLLFVGSKNGRFWGNFGDYELFSTYETTLRTLVMYIHIGDISVYEIRAPALKT